MTNFDILMKRAGDKVNFARASLQGVGKTLRDDSGFSFTANRLLSGISNFLDTGSSTKFSLNEAFANGMSRNFSMTKNNFSASDLQSVYDMDVIDISIAATVASHGLTYVAMERAMKSVKQSIEFQKLVAQNSAAGYSKGQTVIDPRQAIAPIVDLGRTGATGTLTVAAGTAPVEGKFSLTIAAEDLPIVSGETHIYLIEGNVRKEIGFTSTAVKPVRNVRTGGDVIETIVMTDGSVITGGNINASTGAITLFAANALAENTSIEIDYQIDRIAEQNGAHTLKLRPVLDTVELQATENRVILNTSVEVQAQMNKIYRENSQYGVDVDYGKRAIDQVVMLYTYFIDLNVIRSLWEGAKNLPVEAELDLSSFGQSYTSFSNTKNDRISLFVRTLGTRMLNRTGLPMTAMICDTEATLMLASDSENFKDEPAFRTRRDGLVGYYNNIPVIRNVYLDGKDSETFSASQRIAGTGIVLGVHKSLSGDAAPVAFGDYLPPYSTIAAVNPMNPGELSQALFSQTATKCVVPEFIVRGRVIQYTLNEGDKGLKVRADLLSDESGN